MFISLLMKITNSISIDHTSAQKTNQTFSQKFRTEVYISNFLKWPGASPGLVGLLGQGWAGGAPLKPWGSRG